MRQYHSAVNLHIQCYNQLIYLNTVLIFIRTSNSRAHHTQIACRATCAGLYKHERTFFSELITKCSNVRSVAEVTLWLLLARWRHTITSRISTHRSSVHTNARLLHFLYETKVLLIYRTIEKAIYVMQILINVR